MLATNLYNTLSKRHYMRLYANQPQQHQQWQQVGNVHVELKNKCKKK
jgi:hypothetical protein